MMNPTVHSIKRYSVQVLSKLRDMKRKGSIIVRLYNDKDEDCGTAVFKNYGNELAENPTGDFKSQRATAFYDIGFYNGFIDILRVESELFWKIAWVQMGANREVSEVSLDTKKEIIGEFFQRREATER